MAPNGVTEDEVPQIKRSRWADNFFRPLLIIIMIMSFNFSLVNLVRLINPAWSGIYFLVGMLLTTVEAIYSFRVLKHLRSHGVSVLRYRLAEAMVLVLLLKILTFADMPLAQIWAELQLLWREPASFINIEFYVILFLGAVAWIAATSTVSNFEELHDPYTFRSERIMPLDSLATRFFWGGVALVFISGMTQWVLRAGVSSLVDFRRPSLGGVLLNVLTYFTAGLILLSQAHLSTLLTRWQVQKIKVTADLVRQWAKYGFLFLGLVTLGAFFLPTRFTLGFLTSAAILIQYLLSALAFLIQLLLFLVSLPFLWLFSLLGQSTENLGSAPGQLPPLPQSGSTPTPIPWLEAFRSLVFWLLAISIIWYLVKVYISEHPEMFQSFKRFRPVALLLDLLDHLWRALFGLALLGYDLIPKRVNAASVEEDSASGGRRGWFGLRGASARQRILYYYLNILQRAEGRGPIRKGHQTPFEYEPDLSRSIPQAQSSVNLLTQAFVRARYSRDPVHQGQAAIAKKLWRQIRRELRKRGEGPEERRERREEREEDGG